MKLPEGHRHFSLGPHKEVAPGVWLHEIGTKDEWIEILLSPCEMELWRERHRDNVLYFYNEYRNRWQWDRGVSDRAVRGEVARVRPMRVQDYIIGASETANGFMVVEILKERMDGEERRKRLRIIDRGCRLALRGRFQLTTEPVTE